MVTWPAFSLIELCFTRYPLWCRLEKRSPTEHL